MKDRNQVSIEIVERGPWSRELFDRTPTTGTVAEPVRLYVKVMAKRKSLATAVRDINHLWNQGYVVKINDFCVTPRSINLAWPTMPIPS